MDGYLCSLYTGGNILGYGIRELLSSQWIDIFALCTLVEIYWVVELEIFSPSQWMDISPIRTLVEISWVVELEIFSPSQWMDIFPMCTLVEISLVVE